MMSTDEAIKRLKLMKEPKQDKNNQAIDLALFLLKKEQERIEQWKSIKK